MGPHLRGVSPPFTPSGNAAMLRSRTGKVTIDRPNIGGHTGLLLKWRARRDLVLQLLPPPLEAIDASDEVFCFLNQTQGGLNLFQGDDSALTLLRVNPQHLNWNEAIFYIQCRFGDMYGQYIPLIYKDVDHGVLLGHQNGWHTKLVTFHRTFPMPAFAERELRPGSVVRFVVSRLNHMLVSASLRIDRQIDPSEMALNSRPPLFGIRYFPDVLGGGGRTLVHDLVLRQPRTPGAEDRPAQVTHAWVGTPQLTLGTSDLDELTYFEPLEMLEGHFIHFGTVSGVITKGGARLTRVLHAYGNAR